MWGGDPGRAGWALALELWAVPGVFGVPDPAGALQRGQTSRVSLQGCFPAVLGQTSRARVGQPRAAVPGNTEWKFSCGFNPCSSVPLGHISPSCSTPGARSHIPFPTFPVQP